MPRTVTVSLPSHRTDSLLEEIRRLPGLITLSVQRGISLQPPGDVVNLELTDRALPQLMHVLEGHGSGTEQDVSVSIGEPVGMISASSATAIARDVSSSSSFEEMDFVIGRESNMDLFKLVVMAIAGFVAAAGIGTNAVHLVIGAMLIAPGFEPLVRVSLGAVGGNRAWKWGLLDTVKGYGVLVLGAAAGTLLLRSLGTRPLGDTTGYLSSGVLVEYWTTFSWSSTVVTIAAGLAGAILIAASRSVLTTGVMIALALVPSATLVGAGLATWQIDLAWLSFLRWLHDASIVVGTALMVIVAIRLRRGRGHALTERTGGRA
ncbi:DUF389 domain-containing protein [Pseudarthrobacter sp. NS4]|uniref:DUF389 domain-containing protein n=1 Tax=Pseudarthrobacter sp. NS4 TaxID=2973976 RepID=UPI0021634B50|nr:DUF389 domain-containing protein [Pseudarthrobacter sp. NS4]